MRPWISKSDELRDSNFLLEKFSYHTAPPYQFPQVERLKMACRKTSRAHCTTPRPHELCKPQASHPKLSCGPVGMLGMPQSRAFRGFRTRNPEALTALTPILQPWKLVSSVQPFNLSEHSQPVSAPYIPIAREISEKGL